MKQARVLCIDGGGIRGLIPATILTAWEKELGPIASRFHMIAGTSTGGILATGLGIKTPAEKLASFYHERGPQIFSNTLGAVEALAGSIYSPEPLEAALKDVFGLKPLSSVVDVDLLITAYEMESRTPRLFKSWRAQGIETPTPRDDDFLLTAVTRATSAAPTYFPPARVRSMSRKDFTMVDGGVYANNPSMCAYVAARRLYPMADSYLIVSIGTGALTQPYSYEEVASWGIAGWAQPLLDVMFSGVSDTTDYQLDQLAPEVAQYRFQSKLGADNQGMDDVRAANLQFLVETAQATIKDNPKNESLMTLLKTPLTSKAELGYPQTAVKPAPKVFSKPPKMVAAPANIIKPEDTNVTTGAAAGMLGGAALGGAALGPVGAVVGGIAGALVGMKAFEKK